jgi:mRNA (guanine-N7-)-methyltransferase
VGDVAIGQNNLQEQLWTWSLQEHDNSSLSAPPRFEKVSGGGITDAVKFDVVSIQFALHYMMSSQERARRFFRTVSDCLAMGGNLIATTMDARVIVEHLMNAGHNFHFDTEASPVQNKEEDHPIISLGGGACQIRFTRRVVQRSFEASSMDDLFGLEYKFTLIERNTGSRNTKVAGSHHQAATAAVDLPEWLTPLPLLQSLAQEVGLELEYYHNFHEFFQRRQEPYCFPEAHRVLTNMKVLNRHGSISHDEWEISRLYCALKFRKVR